MSKKQEKKVSKKLKEFFFPLEGRTIKAESLEEATKLLKGE